MIVDDVRETWREAAESRRISCQKTTALQTPSLVTGTDSEPVSASAMSLAALSSKEKTGAGAVRRVCLRCCRQHGSAWSGQKVENLLRSKPLTSSSGQRTSSVCAGTCTAAATSVTALGIT